MAIEPDGPGFNCISNSPSTGGMVFDYAHPAGWIFGDFFIENFPACSSYTGIFRNAPRLPPSHQLLSHSSPIPPLFLAQKAPQLSREGDKWRGIVWTSVDGAVLSLAIFSHLSHWWF